MHFVRGVSQGGTCPADCLCVCSTDSYRGIGPPLRAPRPPRQEAADKSGGGSISDAAEMTDAVERALSEERRRTMNITPKNVMELMMHFDKCARRLRQINRTVVCVVNGLCASES